MNSYEGYKFMPDGEHECEPVWFDKRTLYRNVTVEVLENMETGAISIGWYRQENTEEVEEFE